MSSFSSSSSSSVPDKTPLTLLDESSNDVLRSIPIVIALSVVVYLTFPNKAFRKWKARTERHLWWLAVEAQDRILIFLGRQEAPFRLRRQAKRYLTFDRKAVTFRNFHNATRANFRVCERPVREPDYKGNRSWYWNVDDKYVIRSSEQWSNEGLHIRANWWTIDETAGNEGNVPTSPDNKLTGMCIYEDFCFIPLYHVDFENFFRGTRAHYTSCDRPQRRPDHVSASGSAYWDIRDHAVIRCSDHWSNTGRRIADCWWTYEQETYLSRIELCGICPYERFESQQYGRTRFTHANDRKLQALLLTGWGAD